MISVMEVYQLLPKTNCKRCCLSACMAFAFELLRERKAIEDCTPLVEEPKYEEKLMGHRLRQESRCGSDPGSKSDEIGLIKEVTASHS